jgi:hypothetical protein
LPARARFPPFLVGEHAAEDDVGQPAFQRPHGHHGRQSAGSPCVVAGAAFGLVPQLDDRHDVQDPVDAPVPGAGEAVAAWLMLRIVLSGRYRALQCASRSEIRMGRTRHNAA